MATGDSPKPAPGNTLQVLHCFECGLFRVLQPALAPPASATKPLPQRPLLSTHCRRPAAHRVHTGTGRLSCFLVCVTNSDTLVNTASELPDGAGRGRLSPGFLPSVQLSQPESHLLSPVCIGVSPRSTSPVDTAAPLGPRVHTHLTAAAHGNALEKLPVTPKSETSAPLGTLVPVP